MTKILSFDKKLSERINSKIVFGILYQSKFRSSITVKEELEVQFNKNLGLKVDDLTVEFVSIDVNEPYMLEQSIEEKKINVLYLTPLRVVSIADISNIAKKKHILTFSGVPAYSEEGISVTFGIKGERPLIIVNLEQSKREGADFSSQLLRVARVIQ
jgi:hypothetical protein